MKIINISEKDLISNQNLNDKFLSVYDKKNKIDCKILKNNFYLDSFNYFPITDEGFTFKNLYQWGNDIKYDNFYLKDFAESLEKKKNDLKIFDDVFILGSSPTDNYYRNITTFLPRIFFINQKEIKLAVHRNSSNKFRVFISEILNIQKIKIKQFIYLDDDFYNFNNSQIPQFLNRELSIKLLNKKLSYSESEDELKIYVSRQNTKFRNIVNEEDIIEILKSQGFKIINTNNMSIFEQIELFSKASVVVASTGSSLTNIIFCKKGTKIFEIKPVYQFKYENRLQNRFLSICKILEFQYSSFEADSIDVDPKIKLSIDGSDKGIKINKKVLNESNYYRDLLVKKNLFSEKLANL